MEYCCPSQKLARLFSSFLQAAPLFAAALPLISGMPSGMVWIMGPIAAAIAAASVAIARRPEQRRTDRKKDLRWQPLPDVLATEDHPDELGNTGGLLKPVEHQRSLADSLVRPAESVPINSEYLLRTLPTGEPLEAEKVSETPPANEEEPLADQVPIGSNY